MNYWVQGSRDHRISPECAISPIFSNKEALIEWLTKAMENGLTEYIICDDMAWRTYKERQRQVEKTCYIKKE